ncbi:nicotinamide riboside transporter PnuC [Sphingomonas turrisvirgatae]|uniref:Nicotinamide riboside transporter PnuC n=1 Tax=Sphingomonas turrisvirgatae TaxID=1888892 RepID=A0A1E3LX11_9SPHN|nr:nicotinamide riboside transporter PnuC [Sphingomonas turrisvirgatae]ODP38352.1 nicotinamide mononucleotide transporter [Sphingomonas turrisvirgatae]
MNLLEILAATLVLINIALVARRSVWNYPFGIVAVTLYGFVFLEARLYSDMLLQGFFLVLNLYGWANWRASRAQAGEVVVLRLNWRARVASLAAICIATAAWGWLMHRLTDAAAPWWDASVAIASVAAQLLLARRYVENWALWIIVDLIAVPLYATRGLWLTSGIYVVLLGLSIWGAIDWQRARPR